MQNDDFTNYVGLLNNYCQEQKLLAPEYKLEEQVGKSHIPIFKMSCTVNGITTYGIFSTKQKAKCLAAKEAIKFFNIKLDRSFGESFKLFNAFPEQIWQKIWEGQTSEMFFTIRKRTNGDTEELKTFKAILTEC
ncbi:hypothetical protein AGMMS49579_15280 [Spirochaetia bacterium]|nr:hypothetical protein AGMMS49579_15280 [Spirochaetia bacterium]